MATKIIDGIFKLYVPMPDNPLENTNAYLIKSNNGDLLIDTGWNSDISLQALERELQDAGTNIKNVRRIVVTHSHPDHYGLVSKIKKTHDVTIYLHRREKEIFRTRYALTKEMVQEGSIWFQSHGVPKEEMPLMKFPYDSIRAKDVILPDVELEGGETIAVDPFKLQVIWTPGHSPGHICLFDAEHKLFFSGDHILPSITPNIGLLPGSSRNPLGEFTQSLKSLRNLDVDTVLPGHQKILHDLKKRVDALLHHHESRNQEILKGLQKEPLTAYQVSHHIKWLPEQGGLAFTELLTWGKVAAVSETLSHLQAMTIEGRIKTFNRDGLIYYELAV
jgi:glyoxylase-like metal-dependent hydrolase (beta-lactamase superfamily II)